MPDLVLTTDDREDKNGKVLAIFITLLIHAGIVLFLLYYVIITPIPPYPEPPGGPEMELDFGNAVNGTGTAEANNIGNNQSEKKSESPSVSPTKAENPVITNDVENTTPIASSKKETKKPEKRDTVKPQPQISIDLASAVNKFKSAKGSSGGNGNSGQAGNAGLPDGTNPGTSIGTGNGLGVGNGKGFNFNVAGRRLLSRPQLKENNPVQGQIVVGITVDQNGNVTEATPGARGTTITDESLYILVKNAAMQIKFNKSPDDVPEQSGTVTFVFTIQ